VTVRWQDSAWAWLPVSLLLVLADQASKAWIEARYLQGEFTPVFFWLDITRVHNSGAAFSFLADAGGWQRYMLSVLAAAVSVGMLFWMRRLHARRDVLLSVALALVLSGALGNLIDRLEHGYVVDFIHLHWQGSYFPAFNVADAAISVGAALLIVDAIRDLRRG
jgi:signal peptidase II